MSLEVQWIIAADDPPPEGVVVMTMSPGGFQQPLKRSGSLWFDPPGEMYVYYVPVFWRDLSVDEYAVIWREKHSKGGVR